MNSQVKILRETEFYQGFIRLKMSVTNETASVITDVDLDFRYDENTLHIDSHEPVSYQSKNGKILLGNIHTGESKSISIFFEPQTCSGSASINCQVTYRDANGQLNSEFMEPKKISVVCPILKTESDINIGRLKEFIEKLPSRDSKIYEIQNNFDINKLASIAREVVEKHDVRHIRTLHTKDGRECEIWYYGRTKVQQENLVIKLSFRSETQTLELFAATERSEALTGFLAEVGRNLKQNLESISGGRSKIINLSIKDSVIQHSNLLDHCDMSGACSSDIIVENSLMQHTGISSGVKTDTLKPSYIENREYKALNKENEELVHLRKELEELRRQREEELLRKQQEEKEKLRQEIEQLKKQKMEDERIKREKEEERIQKEKIEQNLKRQRKGEEKSKVSNSVRMEFVKIPSGEFLMGSNEYKNEQPVHKVTIRTPFLLGKYPVTQKQWIKVMGYNPSRFKADDLPVENVSWDKVQEFIQKLNHTEGIQKYRLPSEAEWEYACRAGTTTRYSFGDDDSKLEDYVWCSKNSNKTHLVGQKKSNPWGLYDMNGNVWEWCQDKWYGNYDVTPCDGSSWEEGSSSERVIRGGGWRNRNSMNYLSAFRNNYESGKPDSDLGFRVLREL